MKKGFTLIELLVVIAIIGILSGIVLVSLRRTRIVARDARIQGDLAQVRNIAELIYSANSPNSYVGICDTADNTLNQGHPTYGSELGRLETDITTQNGGTVVRCYQSDEAYCVSTALASGGNICTSDAGIVRTGVACTAATDCH
jgi:prepilin-type N-terminal cleavage/methylation domain-containing protein